MEVRTAHQNQRYYGREQLIIGLAAPRDDRGGSDAAVLERDGEPASTRGARDIEHRTPVSGEDGDHGDHCRHLLG